MCEVIVRAGQPVRECGQFTLSVRANPLIGKQGTHKDDAVPPHKKHFDVSPHGLR